MKPRIEVQEIAFHRNGVGGNGFHAIRFTEKGQPGEFLAIVFEEPGDVAVINAWSLAEFGVGHGNKWRGDIFEDTLREAIAADNEAYWAGNPQSSAPIGT